MTTKMQMQKQIPFGDDNQKNTSKGVSKYGLMGEGCGGLG